MFVALHYNLLQVRVKGTYKVTPWSGHLKTDGIFKIVNVLSKARHELFRPELVFVEAKMGLHQA
jgi:hypothetical protein